MVLPRRGLSVSVISRVNVWTGGRRCGRRHHGSASADERERQGAGLCRRGLAGRVRRGPGGCLLLFVMDASGSMGAWQRMRQTKAAVLALLLQAYQRRDRVALLAFRGHRGGAGVAAIPGLAKARQALERLPVGGTTPLAHGLEAASRLVRGQQRRQPRQPVWVVLLTDGRTNVARNAGRIPGWTPWPRQGRGRPGVQTWSWTRRRVGCVSAGRGNWHALGPTACPSRKCWDGPCPIAGGRRCRL